MKKPLLVCLALCVLFFGGLMVSAASESETVKGWVSDTKCGAKGMSTAHAACAKKCAAAGEKLALVTDKDKQVLTVANPDALQGHEGHHVEVKGQLSGDSITIDKDSVKMLAAEGGKGSGMEDMHK